jgi:hypothetical protein
MVPPGDGADRIRGERVSYSCHPKRCEAEYDLGLAALTSKVLEGMQGDRVRGPRILTVRSRKGQLACPTLEISPRQTLQRRTRPACVSDRPDRSMN